MENVNRYVSLRLGSAYLCLTMQIHPSPSAKPAAHSRLNVGLTRLRRPALVWAAARLAGCAVSVASSIDAPNGTSAKSKSKFFLSLLIFCAPVFDGWSLMGLSNCHDCCTCLLY